MKTEETNDYCITGMSYRTDQLEEKTYVALSVRDKYLNRETIEVPYDPYFYYLNSESILIEKLFNRYSELEDYILYEQRGYYSTEGRRLTKVVVKYPYNVKEFTNKATSLREHIGKWINFYESNILFVYRYLIDHNIYTGIDSNRIPVKTTSRHRVMFLDIEVEGEEEYKEESDKYPVIIVGFYDCYTKTYHILHTYFDTPLKIDHEKVLKSEPKDYDSFRIYPCKDEESLFNKLKEVWKEYSPDVVATFSTFDIKYLVRRMRKKNIDYSFLSPIGVVTSVNHIHCLDVVDYAEVYRKVFREPMWDTLDFISKKELGYGKIELEERIYSLWRKNPKKVIEYNLRDVELLKDLEEELGLIEDFIKPIWSYTGLQFSKCIIPNTIGDILHLRDSYGKEVWRSKSYIKASKYKGALVRAKPGLYEYVAILDWSELYQSIMETFHISWDTYSRYGGEIKLAENLRFSNKTPGQTVRIMKPFRNKRRGIKLKINNKEYEGKKGKRKLKMLSEAFKVIGNASYGAYGYQSKTGYFGSRLYDPNVAAAITLMGRVVFEEVMNYVPTLGYEIIYGDTDSIFVKMKIEDIEKESTDLANNITDHISKFIEENYKVPSTLKMNYDCILRRIIILTKKRYHGITMDGEHIVKGLEIVRRNTAPITVEVEQKAGEILLSGGSVEDFIKYKYKMINKVKNKEVSLEDIALRVRCTQDEYDTLTRNYKARLIGERITGVKIKKGVRFYLLYVNSNDKYKFDLKLKGEKKTVDIKFESIGLKDLSSLPKGVMIDYDKMANRTVEKPLEKYLEALGEKDDSERENAYKYRSLDEYW